MEAPNEYRVGHLQSEIEGVRLLVRLIRVGLLLRLGVISLLVGLVGKVYPSFSFYRTEEGLEVDYRPSYFGGWGIYSSHCPIRFVKFVLLTLILLII